MRALRLHPNTSEIRLHTKIFGTLFRGEVAEGWGFTLAPALTFLRPAFEASLSNMICKTYESTKIFGTLIVLNYSWKAGHAIFFLLSSTKTEAFSLSHHELIIR